MLINGGLNSKDFAADELQNPHVAVVNLERQMVCSKQPSETSSLDDDQKGRRAQKKEEKKVLGGRLDAPSVHHYSMSQSDPSTR